MCRERCETGGRFLTKFQTRAYRELSCVKLGTKVNGCTGEGYSFVFLAGISGNSPLSEFNPLGRFRVSAAICLCLEIRGEGELIRGRTCIR